MQKCKPRGSERVVTYTGSEARAKARERFVFVPFGRERKAKETVV